MKYYNEDFYLEQEDDYRERRGTGGIPAYEYPDEEEIEATAEEQEEAWFMWWLDHTEEGNAYYKAMTA